MNSKYKKYFRSLLIAGVSLVLLSICAIGTLEYFFRNKNYRSIKIEHSVWQHRVNSAHLLEAAIKQDAKGIEIDIIINDDNIYVSHDLPTKESLLLTDFIKLVPREMQIWMDFKQLTVARVPASLSILENIDKKYDIRRRALIESKNTSALSLLSKSGFHTLFWIYPYPNTRAHFLYNLKNKFLITTSSFTGISMDHTHLDTQSSSTFKSTPLFLFTINDQDKLRDRLKQENVKVILTDKYDE